MRLAAVCCVAGLILCWQGKGPAWAEDQAPAAATPAASAGDEGAAPAAPAAPTEEQTKETLQTPAEPSPAVSVRVERGGLLVGKGKWNLDCRLAYAHFSRNVIFIDGVAILPVLVVGEVAVEHIRRDVIIGSVAGRYGVTDKLQVELKIPYRFQNDQSSIPEATPPQEKSITDLGLGDIELGGFYQLPVSRVPETKVVLGLRFKTRTGRDVFEIDPTEQLPMGTGFNAARASLTFIHVSDPAAIFGTVGYTHNFARRNLLVTYENPETGQPTQDRASFYPGSSIEVGGGLAYALNPVLSLNAQVYISHTRATWVSTSTTTQGRHVPVAGTTLQVASLRFGAVFAESPRASTEISVETGLTTDSPDMVVEICRSYRY